MAKNILKASSTFFDDNISNDMTSTKLNDGDKQNIILNISLQRGFAVRKVEKNIFTNTESVIAMKREKENRAICSYSHIQKQKVNRQITNNNITIYKIMEENQREVSFGQTMFHKTSKNRFANSSMVEVQAS